MTRLGYRVSAKSIVISDDHDSFEFHGSVNRGIRSP
jgi:hypothetical protein